MNQKLAIVGVLLILIIVVLVGFFTIKKPASQAPGNASTQTQTSVGNSSNVPSDNIYLTKTDPSKGKYLTDFQGQTLYTFDKDTNGVSNCSGQCLIDWPAYTSGAVAQSTFPENISVITRSDGSKQFAWKGMPLYYFKSDKNPGEISGDNVGGFHIVIP